MTEQELIQRALEGDTMAFTGLVDSYQVRIYNLCYRILGESKEAEDAAQETFLRAFHQLHRYNASRPFKTWLFAIAAHYCIDQCRKRRMAWVEVDDESLASHPALCESVPGPEERVILQEQSAGIQDLLKGLHPKERAAIVMRYWDDFSYEEIAEASGVTIKAVKSRLHRARRALAEKVSQNPGSAKIFWTYQSNLL